MKKTSLFLLPLLIALLSQASVWPPAQAIRPSSPASEFPAAAVIAAVPSAVASAPVRLTDGDLLRLSASLPQVASHPTWLSFFLDDAALPLAGCQVAVGQQACQTDTISTFGWHWALGVAAPHRTIRVKAESVVLPASLRVQVNPRPVVMVHGFISSFQAWSNYLGSAGYLAEQGIPGYAVGDGQVEGVMNTGDIRNPAGRTNTIAENAAILGRYIAGVKRLTGAQQVDLVVHSMGGLISRYYIDRIMAGRDVAQLIMLGSPQLGTDCANLPAALNFYLPATLEIRPGYVNGIFNPQITHRRGVPFYAVAGTRLQEAMQSPCTPVPSDVAVSLDSVSGIPLHLAQIPVLHTDLNTSRQVFEQEVLPLLKRPASEVPTEPDPPLSPASLPPLQFTRVYTGLVTATSPQQVTIQVEPNMSVASFALFDNTHSLTVTVVGASGNQIQLDPQKNGLVTVEDPAALLYLGYGFKNPKPGPWNVTLSATDRTPPAGAVYALTAQFQGGVTLQAQVDPLVPRTGDKVHLSVYLEQLGQIIPINAVTARIHAPGGDLPGPAFRSTGETWEADWIPPSPGLYGLDLTVTGRAPAGLPIERSAFLAVEAQPTQGPLRGLLLVGGVGLLVFVLVIAGASMTWLFFRRRRRINHS